MLLSKQIELLQFPPEIKQHSSNFSLRNLNSFVEKYIDKMIEKNGVSTVQYAIDSDNKPYNSVINYITCVMELGMLHELFHQSFYSSNKTILNQRIEFLAWAINISVANTLKKNGLLRIPSIVNGQVNIYFSWNNLKILIQRISPIAIQFDGAESLEVKGYIENLIYENLA